MGEQMTGKKPLVRFLSAVLQVLLPVLLVLTSVRLLLTEEFIRFEYATPGFPTDRYGFTREDRLRWAPLALDFLLNDEGIDFLSRLAFPDGTKLYNQRELRHMQDVKELTQTALAVWSWGWVAAVVLGSLLWRVGGSSELSRTLRLGAKWTVIAIGLLGILLVVGFSLVFVGFHRIFFEGETWLFRYQDTLIRLFPERFWQIAFGTIVLLTILQAALIHIITAISIRRGGIE